MYMKSTDEDGNPHTQLLCAKSHVAPIKSPQTIPRLELCAALLLAKLYTTVKESITAQIHKTVF